MKREPISSRRFAYPVSWGYDQDGAFADAWQYVRHEEALLQARFRGGVHLVCGEAAEARTQPEKIKRINFPTFFFSSRLRRCANKNS